MKRRNFIQLSTFATAALSFSLLYSCNPSSAEKAEALPIFLSRLFDENTIKDTGQAYLKKTPAENNENRLMQLLADNKKIAIGEDEKAIHEYLNKKIKTDFETGSTVMIKGWVLAVTEARQCALFSLIKG
ncbi:MAG: hypothetical protein JO072_02500 [Parafilimonas sp.]|nr:hypothetical protein [Parafilimonas sp.]